MSADDAFDGIGGFEEFDVDPKAMALQAIDEILASGPGVLREDQALAIAEYVGVTSRTIYNWAKQRRSQFDFPPDERPCLEQIIDVGPSAFYFDDLMIAAMYAAGGNLTRLRNDLDGAGYPVPSYPTMQRAWKSMSTMIRNGAKKGLKNRSKHCLYVTGSSPAPNMRWQLDDFWLDIEVIGPDGQVCRPHLLVLIDDCDRFIPAVKLCFDPPTSKDVLELFAEAFERWGVPDVIVTDNATIFHSAEVLEALAAVGSTELAVAVYTPTTKGKVERAGQTLQSRIVDGVAGVLTQVESISGRDLAAAHISELLSWEPFAEHVRNCHVAYLDNPHSALAGRTPADARSSWTGTPKPADMSVVAHWWPQLPKRNHTRTVQPTGVFVDYRYWVGPDLADVIGHDVTVRTDPAGDERLAVFDDGHLVGFAKPGYALTDDELKAIFQERRALQQAVRQYAKDARKIRAERARTINLGADAGYVASALAVEAAPSQQAPAPSPAAGAPKAARPSVRGTRRTKKTGSPKPAEPTSAEKAKRGLDIAKQAAAKIIHTEEES